MQTQTCRSNVRSFGILRVIPEEKSERHQQGHIPHCMDAQADWSLGRACM